MMTIKKAVYKKSYSDAEVFLSEESDLPKICVVGRSNVGKSTFINTLCANSKLCKTSSSPGRTRLINIFEINDCFELIDLPGYGYAEASKQERKEWNDLMESFFASSMGLAHTFVLMDIRREPSELDRSMLEYLYFYRKPFSVIATKSDKLSKSQIAGRVTQISSALKIGRDNIIAVSHDGLNREKVLELIEDIIRR